MGLSRDEVDAAERSGTAVELRLLVVAIRQCFRLAVKQSLAVGAVDYSRSSEQFTHLTAFSNPDPNYHTRSVAVDISSCCKKKCHHSASAG